MATLNVSDLNRQGKVFYAANVSVKSFVAVSTTATGLMVYNPNGSGKKVVLIDAGFAWTTVPGAVHNLGIAVMNQNNAVPTANTVSGVPAQAADGSGNVGSAVAWDASTLPAAPTARRWFAGAAWGSGAAINPFQILDRIDGSIILIPGSLAIIAGLTTTALGVAHLTWAELPI